MRHQALSSTLLAKHVFWLAAGKNMGEKNVDFLTNAFNGWECLK